MWNLRQGEKCLKCFQRSRAEDVAGNNNEQWNRSSGHGRGRGRGREGAATTPATTCST